MHSEGKSKGNKKNCFKIRPLYDPSREKLAPFEAAYLFGRSFLLGHFWVMRPNIRPAGNTMKMGSKNTTCPGHFKS